MVSPANSDHYSMNAILTISEYEQIDNRLQQSFKQFDLINSALSTKEAFKSL